LLSEVAIFAIGALGLNLLTGLAGQISLGHAFFMGLGAYTAAWLGADPGNFYGLGLPIWNR
jgi:branched-chain amino acid transport system permease protein